MGLEDQILQAIVSGISSGCIYAFVGIAIAVVYNVSRIFDVSQGQYLMLGAILVPSLHDLGLSIPLSIVAALGVSLTVGLVIWRVVFYGPSQRYPHLTLIMISFGIAMLIEGVAYLILGTDIRLSPYYLNIAPIRISQATMSPQAPFIIGSLTMAVIALSFLFGRTFLGKALRACREELFAVRLAGINPRNMMYFSFLLGVAVSSIGGIVMVPLTGASYDMGMHLVIKGFLAALVGGISKFQGVIVGGLALGVVESVSAGFVSSSYASIITLTIFVIALLFRPSGIVG